MEYINKKFLLVKRPQGMPQDDCWKFESNTIDTIKRGEIIMGREILRTKIKRAKHSKFRKNLTSNFDLIRISDEQKIVSTVHFLALWRF